MPEFCSRKSSSSINKPEYNHQFNTIFIDLFLLLCFFLLSHHLCFAIRSVLEKFRWKADEERGESRPGRKDFEELKAFKDVFEVTENPVREALTRDSDEKAAQITQKLEGFFLQEKEIWCETVGDCRVGGEKVLELVNPSKVEGQRGEKKKPPLIRTASSAVTSTDQLIDTIARVNAANRASKDEDSQNLWANSGSFGQIRKEKECTRSLAYMLFKERINGGGGSSSSEGMDSLWETYEAESNKLQEKTMSKKKTNTKTTTTKTTMMNKKKGDIDFEKGEDEDDGESNLCCLQALKLSTVKMNVGMGKPPGIVKIFKALKGVGWLHKKKKKKKGYNS